MLKQVIFCVIIIGFITALFYNFEEKNYLTTYVENSGPFLGIDLPRSEGINGDGIVIAVIDTGVDYEHPDLFGFGPDGKVIGGHNFINDDEPPLDTNGHGTQVAGIIAADGEILGIAPKAKILAYKVSEDGEGVESKLIINAIRMAIKDGADIINISLGVNRTNSQIDSAVNDALEKNIFIVTAAGNDGPNADTIGSPGRNFESITVGATYNNLTSSLVATLEVNDKPYTVIPMVGSEKLDDPITGKIIFAEYGRERDFEKTDVNDKIVLVERGSDVKDEIVYFSTKEKNAADNGAKALIVYNNEPGIFLGELIHEFVEPDYSPRIPVVSIERQDGLEIKEKINNENKGFLHLFFNPDFVAHFSSRGPVSPFYIKPDLVAPGAYINTTKQGGGYNFTSGTSYAVPHVSGAAALLMQKYPDIHHHEIKSIFITTTEPVSNAIGNEFSINDAGSGRINIGKAINADLIIEPPQFVLNISSDEPTTKKQLHFKTLKGDIEKLTIESEIPDFFDFEYNLENENLVITISATENNYGSHEGKIFITHNEIKYTVPFIIHFTESSVKSEMIDNKMFFSINQSEQWQYAKISVTNSKTGKTDTTTITPNKESFIPIYDNGEYWIEANILVDGQTFNAYQIVDIENIPKDITRPVELFDLPEKQIAIVIGIVAIIGIVGIYFRTRRSLDQRF